MADTDCECRPKTYHGRHAGIVYCPLHAAAPELLEALKDSAFSAHVGNLNCKGLFENCGREDCAAAREAIRKAGGE